jgi:hypothetical protein
MRTTTLALLSGAAMSISAASIYNVTPAGGFGEGEMHASLEPLAPRSWPQLEPAAQASATAFLPLASTSTAVTAAPTASPFVDEPVGASTAVAFAEPPPPRGTTQFAAAKPPSTKSASGWRAHRNPKPAFDESFSQPQRVVVVRQEPQPPPQMARPPSTSQSFQSAPPASTARPMSTSSARSASSAF